MMFKKLRNEFLILNLVIISIMMLIAFASIYFITYQDVSRSIDMELRKISDFNHRPNENINQTPPDFDINHMEPKGEGRPPAERSVSFSIIADKQWNMTTIISIFDIENEFYETAKEMALSQNENRGNFKVDVDNWAFKIKPIPEGYRIDFLNITSQQRILKNLIFTFIFVALVMIIFIYLISRFFANKSIKPVKEAFDKQKQFIADASHELKTPLAVINTNIDVLLGNKEDTINNQSKWLHYIQSETERMSKLTNDLLYLTQMDYSDEKMIFSEFNISEEVENVILTMEAIIFENNISLNYNIEPTLRAYGNKEQIKQVVIILLDNAIKYTNPKGSIKLFLQKQNNNIVLSVSNTGEGISEEHVDKIFDRFYRTDKSRSRKLGGYGLGLAIAKTIINQHKGNIYVKSIINDKTTFILELPLSNT